jgi:hypothetical protein
VNEATTLENDENIRDFRVDFAKMVVAAVADDVPYFDLWMDPDWAGVSMVSRAMVIETAIGELCRR